MLKIGLSRPNNSIRADLPAAVAEIRHFQMHDNRISFELQFYADAEAFKMIKIPSGEPMANVENGGVVARKHFSETITVVEGYQKDTDSGSLSQRLVTCCYRWLIDKHYQAATIEEAA